MSRIETMVTIKKLSIQRVPSIMKMLTAGMTGVALSISLLTAGPVYASGSGSGVSVGIQSAMDATEQPSHPVSGHGDSDGVDNGTSLGGDSASTVARGLGITLKIPAMFYMSDGFLPHTATFGGPIEVSDYRGLGAGWTVKVMATETGQSPGTQPQPLVLTKSDGVETTDNQTLGLLRLHTRDVVINHAPVIVASAPKGAGMADTRIRFGEQALRSYGSVLSKGNADVAHNLNSGSTYRLTWSLEDAPQ